MGPFDRIPERESDCSGERPSWYPFQIEVAACDEDEATVTFPEDSRNLSLPSTFTSPSWWPYD